MASDPDRINVVADLLLGAAFADEHFAGREKEKIRELLGELVDGDELPEGLSRRIDLFEAEDFDLAEAAADFAEDPPIKKRKLLELVAAVHEADEELDFAEDEFLHALALAIGVSAEEYADLVLEFEVEELKESLDELASAVEEAVDGLKEGLDEMVDAAKDEGEGEGEDEDEGKDDAEGDSADDDDDLHIEEGDEADQVLAGLEDADHDDDEPKKDSE